MHLSPYDGIAELYDALFVENNPYYAVVTECEWEVFNRWVPYTAVSGNALDIGCGTGLHTSWLVSKGYKTIGIDTSSEMIKIATSKSSLYRQRPAFVVSDAFDESFIAGQRFRVLCCLGSTLNHLRDWNAFAQLASKRLSPGGIFVFSYDNFLGLDTVARIILREYAGYSRRFWKDIVIEKIRALGTGVPFRNHWRVSRPGYEMEVGLTYERTRKWLNYLECTGFQIRELSGAHVLDCWNKRSLRASAGIVNTANPDSGTSPARGRDLLATLDKALGKALPCIASNIVGIATKR